MVAERRGPDIPRGSDGQPLVPCRTCWARIPLLAERVEVTDGRAYYRCQECDAAMLIRWEDAVALGAVPPRPTDP